MGVVVLLYISIKSKSGLIERKKLTSISEDVISFAREKLEADEYKNNLTGSFDDDVWEMNDQRRKVYLRFNYLAKKLQDICHEKNVNYDYFIITLKTIIALRIGTCDIMVLREIVKYSLDEFYNSKGFTVYVKPLNKQHGRLLVYYIDYITLLPFCNEEYIKLCKRTLNVIRLKNNEFKKGSHHPCVLNEFKSYFIFNDVMDEFWKSTHNVSLKNFFFPLYLFWKITTILPMRVTEFCLTPYDCLRKDGDICYLTIRRSHLKGSSSLIPKIHYYQIDKDYDLYEYEIPKWMYDAINEYRILTKGYVHPYNLLLSVEFALSVFEKELWTANPEKPFSSLELADMLKTFYKDIICEGYGFSIVSEEDLKRRYMNEDGTYEMAIDEIMVLQSRHTRHLAMINLIMRGCNPVMIREFAGHADELTSANYYGNVSKTVRCATKYFYDKAKNRKSLEKGFIQQEYEENPLSLMLNEKEEYIDVDNGRCYSKRFLMGDVYDCGTVDGKCISCRYFIPDNSQDIRNNAVVIDSEMDYIMKMLKSKIIENRMTEFQMKTQLLESHINNFATQCWHQMMEGDNGKKTKI